MEVHFQDIFPEKRSSLAGYPDDPGSLSGMRIAITGGAGSIGSEILRSLQKYSDCQIEIWDSDESRMHSLLVTFREENGNKVQSKLVDIRDFHSLDLAFKSFQPNILIHAAALKHVSALEAQPREAFLTNIRGTCNVAECLRIYPVDSALFISTDKAANPTSILGSTKLIGERIWAFQAESAFQANSYSVVRFGNVFLSRGSVVETFIAQIRLGQEITITDTEMTRFFMDVKESAQIITLLLDKKVDGVSILKMGTPISIVDLANRLAKFYESKARIRLIGAKSGEKTHEELFTDSEFAKVTDFGVYLNMPFPRSNMALKDIGENPKNDQEAREQIQALLKL